MLSNSSTPPPGQIPFSHELWRKATHVGALIIPGSYYLFDLSQLQMLFIMVPITILMIFIDISRLRGWAFWHRLACRIGGKLVRGHEAAGDFTGATYILLSVCFTVAMFSRPVAVAALAFIIVGDTLAALVGRKFGRHWFGRKSIEGTLACLVGTVMVALITPQLTLSIAIIGAVVATVTEALSTKIDDNITVPIISGLAMTLTSKILAAI